MEPVNRPTPIPNLLDAAYAAGLLVASPLLAYRLLRTGKWRTDWQGRLGHALELPKDPRPTVLLHGVSVGEVAAAAPLVAALGGADGAGPCRVVLSATTNTGHARAETQYGQRHPVVRYPLDFSRSAHRFLDRVRPDVVALLELEVWPNFTRACADRGIPVVVVNGRLSAGSFRGYRRLRSLLSPSFRRLAAVGAQTADYAERFRAMGVPDDRITVTDSMKWEAPLPERVTEQADRLARDLGVDRSRPVVAAISTGPNEEQRLIEGRPDHAQLLVVPRKPERFEEVAALAPWIRRSSGTRPEAAGDLFLVDTMGEAEAATALGDVVVMGRSFNGLGGSNPVPAARLGRPLVVGPDHGNFDEMVQALVEGGAAAVVQDPWAGVRRILGDGDLGARMSRAGPATVQAHVGATARNAEIVLRQLQGFAGAVGGVPFGS